jgi:ribosomal protein L1
MVSGVSFVARKYDVKYRERSSRVVCEVLKIAKDENTNKAFTESVELQVSLKNYYLQQDKRFLKTIRLTEGMEIYLCRMQKYK